MAQYSEFHFKFVLLGECQTGKTTIMKLVCENKSVPAYKPTIGVDDGVFRSETDQGRFRVIMYDTSGQDRFRQMSYQNLASCQAAIFVYDVSDPNTLEAVESRIKEVCEQKNADRLHKILLGNKTDLVTAIPESQRERVLELAKQYKAKPLECSANSKDSIVKAIHEVVNDLIAVQLLKSATTIDDDFNKSHKNSLKGPGIIQGRESTFERAIIEEPEDIKESNQGSFKIGADAWKTQGTSTQYQSEAIPYQETTKGKEDEPHVYGGTPESNRVSLVVPEGSQQTQCGGNCNCRIF